MRIAMLILVAVVAASGAARADSQDFHCPTEVRGSVELVGGAPEGWVATPQSSPLRHLSTETIGGQPALACQYEIFGTLYYVWRRPPANLPNCSVWQWGFRCAN